MNCIKPGVRFFRPSEGYYEDASDYLDPVMAIAHTVVASVFNEYGYDCTITSAMEGEHSKNSLHYVGRALDFRTRDILSYNADAIVERAKGALGPDFDVVLEKTHLHVEYDPK